MKTLNYTLLAAIAILSLDSCKRADEFVSPEGSTGGDAKKIQKFYGPTQPLGNGIARAWTMFQNNTPVGIGVDITKNALETLPHEHVMMSLQFHPVKNSGTFTHMLLDWAPHGHEPEMYEVPHFDIHFYTQSESDRLSIGPDNDAEFNNYPAPSYLPEMHIPVGGVPQMGVHWVDLLSPELNGAPFTSTFIYGTYDGKVTFYEPMITKDWLMAQTNTVIPIPQAQAVKQDGYYPTEYKVNNSTSPDTYTISMDLIFRQGE